MAQKNGTAIVTPTAGWTSTGHVPGTTSSGVRQKRGTVILSDGTAVAVFVDNDSIKVYTSPDRVTWTSRASITATSVLSLSVAVDTSNNLHLVYTDATTNLRYVKCTYSAGPAYSFGSVENVFTSYLMWDVDICCAGLAPVIIGEGSNSGSTHHTCVIWVRRTSDNTWQAVGTPINNETVNTSKVGNVSIAQDAAGVTSNLCWVVGLYEGTQDQIITYQVNINTGALNVGYVDNLPFSDAYFGGWQTHREYRVFPTRNGEWAVCMVAGGTDNAQSSSGGKALTFWCGRWLRDTNPSFTNGSTRGYLVGWTSATYGANQAFYMDGYSVSTLAFSCVGQLNLAGTGTDFAVGFYAFVSDKSGLVQSDAQGVTGVGVSRLVNVVAQLPASGNIVNFVYGTDSYTQNPYTWDPNWGDTAGTSRIAGGGSLNLSLSTSRADTVVYYGNSNQIRFVYNSTPAPTVPQSGTGFQTQPANGSTVNSNVPGVALYVGFDPVAADSTYNGQSIYLAGWCEVELATDSAFTLNFKKVRPAGATDTGWTAAIHQNASVDGSAALALSYIPLPTASALFQSVWYVRGRQLDQYFCKGPYSTINSFVVSHPPTVIAASPGGGAYSTYSTTIGFTWTYQDSSPDSVQNGYEIIIERNDTGASVYDSGVVAYSGPAVGGTGTVSIAGTPIPGAQKGQPLRWKIRARDQDNVLGPYSSYQLFSVDDLPTVAITAPITTATSPAPTVTWTFTPTSGRAQVQYRVRISNAGGTSVYSSGWVVSATASHTVTTPFMILGTVYTITVEAQDSGGLTGVTTGVVTAAWTPPATPTLTVSTATYDTLGPVVLTWTNASQDASYYSYRVYRRAYSDAGVAGPWTLQYETTVVQSSYTYNDWSAPANQQVDYALEQVATRFGALVESTYAPSNQTPTGTNYWLFSTDIATNPAGVSLVLPIVISDSYTNEYETQEINVIGRGRKTDYGTRWGLNGSLVVQFRDDTLTARARKRQLEAMKDLLTKFYLRTPFGDVYQVTMSDIQVGRVAGVGQREFVDVTIPYMEVV